jgi:hypothetical protein
MINKEKALTLYSQKRIEASLNKTWEIHERLKMIEVSIPISFELLNSLARFLVTMLSRTSSRGR